MTQTAENNTQLHPDKHDLLGYKFKPGQTAKDLVTGKEVKILDAARADYTVKGGE